MRPLKSTGMSNKTLARCRRCWQPNKQMKPTLNTLSLITLLGSAIVGSTQISSGAEEPAPGAAPAVTPQTPPETAPSVVQTPGGTAQPGAIIPIIVMDDAKLTDAIRNLARMAGLNY